ncbi:GntR family transcriptional regulator, partial [Blautia sp. MSK22_86]
TPIREALVTLCNEGILHSFPRFGYQVVSVSREEAQNILDFRLVLEGGYLRQSIGHITEENLAELAEIDERCKQSTDSVWDHWEANTAFHLKLISFSGNAYAYQELERTMNVLKRAYAQFYWQTWS